MADVCFPDNGSKFQFTETTLKSIAMYPHLLGNMVGRDKLGPLHSEWIRYIWDDTNAKALQAYRGGMKTTAIMVIGTVRWMLFNPDDRIAIIRKTFGAAAEVTTAVAQIMERQDIRELFRFTHGHYPKAVMNREGRLRYNFKSTVTPEGNVTAHGLDAGITGKHYDKIMCDDIITLRDRISRAERERTKEMVRELATNIIDPGKGSGWIGTPWHRDDAWNVIQTFCPIAKYPVNDFGHLTEADMLRKRATTTPFLYAANYDLELRSDGANLFQDPVYSKTWDHLIMGTIGHLDTAFDGDHYCALTFMTPLTKGVGQKFQGVGWVYPGNVKDWAPEITRLCKSYRVQKLWVEGNADKNYTADRIATYGVRTTPYMESQNKHLKISTNLYEAWPNIAWAPETEDEYMNMMLDYREGAEPDDAPDSAASLIQRAFPQRRSGLALYQR